MVLFFPLPGCNKFLSLLREISCKFSFAKSFNKVDQRLLVRPNDIFFLRLSRICVSNNTKYCCWKMAIIPPFVGFFTTKIIDYKKVFISNRNWIFLFKSGRSVVSQSFPNIASLANIGKVLILFGKRRATWKYNNDSETFEVLKIGLRSEKYLYFLLRYISI